MDVARIREAVNARLDQFREEGRELRLEELRQRMEHVRGSASIKMVDLLVNDRPKLFFELSILRAASVALEWPDEALELIEAGDVEWTELPDQPWTDEPADGDRADELEARIEQMSETLDEVRDKLGATADQISTLIAIIENASPEQLESIQRQLRQFGATQ